MKWHEYAYDILPRGASKAIGIQALLKVLNINNENCYAFGDGLNDLEMLSLAGIWNCDGNAVPEAKAVADIVTTSSSQTEFLTGLFRLAYWRKSEKII